MPRFLLLAAPLLLALAACGGGDDDDADASPTVFGEAVSPDRPIPTAQVRAVNAIPAGGHWVVGNNNFVIGLTDEKDEPQGGATITMVFFDNANTPNQAERFTVNAVQSAPGVGPEVVHLHEGGVEHTHGGEDDNRVGYYAAVAFDKPGNWGVSVQATLEDGTSGVSNVLFTVEAEPPIPLPGEPAIPSENLTRADVTNISEIDSGDPPNDMHDVKIKDSIANGRPVVIVFSTPAFCASRFCGPVNEEVEDLHDKYKDTVDFVHIEIWRDFAAKQLNPTAKEWIEEPDGTVVEPVVYIVDKGGTIYDRFEGPVAANILEPAVKAVSEGKTHP